MLLAQNNYKENSQYPLICFATEIYYEFVITYHRILETILSFDLDYELIEKLKKSVISFNDIDENHPFKEKVVLVDKFFEMFHYEPINILQKKGIDTCFYSCLVNYEFKYNSMRELIQFCWPKKDEIIFENKTKCFKNEKDADLWKSKMFVCMFNEQKSFIRLLNLFAPIVFYLFLLFLF